MRISSRLVLLGFTLLAIPLPTWADPITVVSTSRRILVQANAGSVTAGPVTLADVQPLTNSVTATNGAQTGTASASVIFSNEPDVLFGVNGSVSTSHNSTTLNAGGHAESTNSIVFDLVAAQQFVLNAMFTTGLQDANNQSMWDVALSPLGGASSPGFHITGSSTLDFLTSGVLQPGRYNLSLDFLSNTIGIGTGGTQAGFNFAFGLNDVGAAATPEPASILLLGTGFVGLIRRQYRKRMA